MEQLNHTDWVSSELAFFKLFQTRRKSFPAVLVLGTMNPEWYLRMENADVSNPTTHIYKKACYCATMHLEVTNTLLFGWGSEHMLVARSIR